MKKAVIYTIVIALIGFIGYFIYQMVTFSIFEVEFKKAGEIKVPNKPYTLNLYYVPGNATAPNFIQVRQLLNDTETVLHNYDGYTFVNDYKIINDTTLQLVLSDTAFPEDYLRGIPDTILFKLP